MPKRYPKEFRQDVVRVALARDPKVSLAQVVKRTGFCSYLFLRGLEHAEEVFTRI